MKKLKLFGLFAAIVAIGLVAVKPLRSALSDITALQGGGSLYNVDVFRLTSTADFKITDSNSYTGFDVDSTTGETTLYNGDVNLGGIGTAPSATNLFALTVPLKNDDSAAWAVGSLIVVDPDCVGCGKLSTSLDQTSWIGFSQAVTAAGSVGRVVVSGYALALTSGTVNRGDVIVSSATTPAAPGYCGSDTTPTTGADVAVAMSSGTAAGGTTLVRVR